MIGSDGRTDEGIKWIRGGNRHAGGSHWPVQGCKEGDMETYKTAAFGGERNQQH